MRAAPQAIGPYQIVRLLGQGGMGVVYEARHPALDRPVALKLIHEHVSSPEALARFGREAQALAAINHPHVVRIHELGRAAQGPYIVTDFVAGQPLSEACQRAGGLPARQAAEVVADLADALAAVHARGILHRDLKPENVLLRQEDGRPVLLDFGLARDDSAERLTQTGILLGTPAYMSPEQADGTSPSQLDERTDVYGLGAILYAALSGRPPFEAASSMALMKRVLMDEPRPLRALRADIPPELEAVCAAALAKDRYLRYPSAAALAADLRRFLAGEQVEALGMRTRARVRVGKGALALAGVALLSLAALGGVAWSVLAGDSGAAADPLASAAATPAASPTPAPSPPPEPSPTPPPPGPHRVRVLKPGEPPQGHSDVAHVGFLADGRAATIGARSRELRTWDLAGETPASAWPLEPELALVLQMVVQPGGKLLGVVALQPEPRRTPQDELRLRICFRAFGGDGRPLDPDLPAGQLAEGEALNPKMDKVLGCAVHPTRPVFALGDHRGGVHLLDAASHTTLSRVRHRDGNPITALAFTPDGERLISVSSGDSDSMNDNPFQLHLWDASDPRAVPPEPLESQLVGLYATCLTVRSDGTAVALGFYAHKLELIALNDFDRVQCYGQDATYGGLRGAGLLGTDRGVSAAHDVPPRALAYSSDGRRVYSIAGGKDLKTGVSKGELRVWDAADGRELLWERFPERELHRLAMSPRGDRMLLGFNSGRVELWTTQLAGD